MPKRSYTFNRAQLVELVDSPLLLNEILKLWDNDESLTTDYVMKFAKALQRQMDLFIEYQNTAPVQIADVPEAERVQRLLEDSAPKSRKNRVDV